ncbi:MAG: DsbA family oxidoreductase [Rhodospirillaceae bacterium]|nr:DsbA family oxidoreductase [Rhodospirillaceae bacterium]
MHSMHIDAYFDPICPWCYIGKRRMEQALALRPNIKTIINWRPFLLNPDMPQQGMKRDVYLLSKFGSEARVRRLLGALEEFGQSEEIEFQFDGINQTPSTIDAHRLARFAAINNDAETADRVVDLLFHAFFNQGLNIGDFDVLLDIGINAGIEKNMVEDALDGKIESGWVVEENAKAHRLGINGVPCYIIDNRFALQGAQQPMVMAKLFDSANLQIERAI